METHYSAEFFQSLVENLQDLCRTTLDFTQFVEVTGYISLEVDNVRKERYVLSELMHSNGHLLSESFCTKAFKTGHSWKTQHNSVSRRTNYRDDKYDQTQNRQKTVNTLHEKNVRQRDSRFQKNNGRQLPYVDNDAEMDCDIENCDSLFGSQPRSHHLTSSLVSRVSTPTKSRESSYSGSKHESTPSKFHTASQGRNICKQETIDKADSGLCGNYSPKNHLTNSSSRKNFQKTDNFASDSLSSWPDSRQVAVDASSRTESSDEVRVTVPEGLDSNLKDVEVKSEPGASGFTEEDVDVIDLDMYEDEFSDSQTEFSSFVEDQSFQDSAIPLFSNCGKVSQFKRGRSESNPYIEKVTRYAVNRFQKFCDSNIGHRLELFSMPPAKLDSLLSDFFKGLRKNDGNPYDPGTLRTMQCHIDKYLRNGRYSWSILKDIEFQGSRETLKVLRDDRGKIKPQFRYDPLTEDDIETLFSMEQLGMSNPDILINSVWLVNSFFFGIKSLAEHFHLKWGDLLLLEDESGEEYLQQILKTGQMGGPKLYAKPQSPNRCFVHLYKEYAARRPAPSLEPTSPFYLNVSKTVGTSGGWYICEALSWYRLSSLWKKMSQAAGLPQEKRPMFNLHLAATGWR